MPLTQTIRCSLTKDSSVQSSQVHSIMCYEITSSLMVIFSEQSMASCTSPDQRYLVINLTFHSIHKQKEGDKRAIYFYAKRALRRFNTLL